MKKITIITVLFVLIILISVLGYFLIINKNTSTTTNPEINTLFPSLEKVKEIIFGNNISDIVDNINPISDTKNSPKQFRKIRDKVLTFTFDNDGNIIFIDKNNGNVFSINPDSEEETRLSNNTFINVDKPTLQTYDDDTLIVSFVDKNTNVLQYIDLKNSTSTLNKTVKIPISINSIDINPYKKSSVVLENKNGDGYLLVYDFDTGKQSYIGKESYDDWNINFLSNSLISLQTKTSSLYPGFLYLLDLNKLSKNKILGNINGLESLVSHDGKKVIFTKNEPSGELTTILYDIENKKSKVLNIKTFPYEKCTWTKDDATIFCLVPKTFPTKISIDDWYKGLISFSDNIFSIDVDNSRSFLERNIDTNLDFVSVKINKNESSLVMLDKNNDLWVYDIYSYDSSF